MKKHVILQLREFIFTCSYMMDNNEFIKIETVEKAIADKKIYSIFDGNLNKYYTESVLSFHDENDKNDFSEKLYEAMISEHIPTNLGHAAKKWGISNNGICFLNSICCEALTSNL